MDRKPFVRAKEEGQLCGINGKSMNSSPEYLLHRTRWIWFPENGAGEDGEGLRFVN